MFQEITEKYFNSLYLQYIQDMRELENIQITNQLNIIRTEQHNKYLANINPSVNVANRKKNEWERARI